MLSRTLQWVGLAALLGLAAVGIGALALVKDRLHIVIQPADTSAQPDPLALVRDELQVIGADLRAIAEGLDRNLGQVGTELTESTRRLETIDGAVAALRRAADAATSASQDRELLTLLRGELAALRDSMAGIALPAAAAVRPAVAVTDDGPVEETPAPLANAAELSEPAAEIDPPTADVVAPSEATPPAKPARFLTFGLPSAGLEFAANNVYRILPSLSRVGFDAKSTLHDFTGVTSSISGEVHANLADPSAPWHGSIRCDAKSLTTGLEGRDEGMREHLATDEHHDIVFDVRRFVADPTAIDRVARTAKGTIEGAMTIRGVTRDIAMPVTIHFDESQRAVVSGQLPLKLTDYGIPVPSQLGLISMEDEVNVWIELRARASRAKDEGHATK